MAGFGQPSSRGPAGAGRGKEERLAELEALVEVGPEDHMQLLAIIEAQEAALNEQRQILDNQSGVVDELNRQLQASLKARRADQDLEAVVEQQRERIKELETELQESSKCLGPGSGGGGDDVEQLRALVEAQESIINDQRQVVESQSALIDELGSFVQSHCGRPQEPAVPRLGNLDGIPECSHTSLSSNALPVATVIATGNGHSSARSGGQRRKPPEMGSPPPGASTRSHGVGTGRRSVRDHHMSQPKELPPPRPNSVFGGRHLGGSGGSSGSTPRARSSTADRLGSRGPSPGCGSLQPLRAASPRGQMRQQASLPRRFEPAGALAASQP